MEEIKNLIRQNPDKFKKNPLLSIVASMCGEEQKIQNTEENWYVVFKETIKLVAITTVEGVEHYFNQLNPTIAYLLINYIKILEFSDLELFMEQIDIFEWFFYSFGGRHENCINIPKHDSHGRIIIIPSLGTKNI